jgi:hypothetical protein
VQLGLSNIIMLIKQIKVAMQLGLSSVVMPDKVED